ESEVSHMTGCPRLSPRAGILLGRWVTNNRARFIATLPGRFTALRRSTVTTYRPTRTPTRAIRCTTTALCGTARPTVGTTGAATTAVPGMAAGTAGCGAAGRFAPKRGRATGARFTGGGTAGSGQEAQKPA